MSTPPGQGAAQDAGQGTDRRTDQGTELAGTSCLVLGAGGFLGGHLCRALVRAGARVHGFGRRPAFAGNLPPVRFTLGEFGDRAALARAVEGAETVFHLLGGTTPEASNSDPAADVRASTLASVHLLELCRSGGVGRVVFVSSGGTVYGIPRAVPIAEDAATDPISAYGINKLAVEKFVQLFARLGGARAVSLRVANPFGPFQDPLRRQGVVPAAIHALLAGRPVEVWGDGSVVRDYVYVEDVAEAMLAAAAYDGPAQVFNVGSGIGRSVVEVVRAVAEAMGRPPSLSFRPARRADVPSNVLDIGLARAALGWTPRTGWPTGLARTVEWIEKDWMAGARA